MGFLDYVSLQGIETERTSMGIREIVIPLTGFDAHDAYSNIDALIEDMFGPVEVEEQIYGKDNSDMPEMHIKFYNVDG